MEGLSSERVIGNWYTYGSESIIRYSGTGASYGIGNLGLWTNQYFDNEVRQSTELTDKEVFEALKKESIKRGFKDGVSLIHHDSVKVWTMSGNVHFKYKNGCLNLHCNTAQTKADGYYSNSGNEWLEIFQDGQWATIIEQPTVQLNGEYTVEDLENEINKLK